MIAEELAIREKGLAVVVVPVVLGGIGGVEEDEFIDELAE